MNILQVNITDDSIAGTNQAVGRLHKGLRARGVNSHILCGDKKTSQQHVTEVPHLSNVLKPVQKVLHKTTWELGLNFAGGLRSFKFDETEAYRQADLLHLHDIHHRYFNYLSLPKITQSKPTVYTLHDMWPLTGHCTGSYDCERWKTGCGNCPYLHSYPYARRDNTHLEWLLKRRTYRRSDITIVAPSRWMADIARHSILRRFDIRHIPHGIDTTVFRPLEQQAARETLGIPPDKKVLMYAAAFVDDRGKGPDLLQEAVRHLPTSLKKEAILLTVGNRSDKVVEMMDMPTLSMGYLEREQDMARAYSASDVFVFPTRAESFGLVALESIACGTPVVAFDVGGVSDTVRPGTTGYLAEPEASDDLAQGITQLLEDDALRSDMSAQCREVAESEYSLETHIQQHEALYREILRERETQAAASVTPRSVWRTVSRAALYLSSLFESI